MNDSVIKLRRLLISDTDFILEVENDPTIWSFSTRTDAPYTRSEIEAFITESLAESIAEGKPIGQLRLVITHLDEAIGFIDLYDIDYNESTASVAIIIYRDDLRDRGFGATALLQLEEYCKTRLSILRLRAEVDPNNLAAKRFFQYNGYNKVSKNSGFYLLIKDIAI